MHGVATVLSQVQKYFAEALAPRLKREANRAQEKPDKRSAAIRGSYQGMIRQLED